MKLSKKNLFILVLLPFFQGCYVIGIANKPSWKKTFVIVDSGEMLPRDFGVEIKLSRSNFLFPLPFVFLSFDKKQYELTFKVHSKCINNLNIDSVSCLISSNASAASKMIAPTFTKHNNNFNFSIDTTISNYTYWETTDAIIKLPKEICNDDLEIQYAIYFNGQQQPFLDKKRLQITKYKTIWVESFF